MSNDANPEYNPSGYPDSSPATEGADQGESPTPERHEPAPDSPRFNEVYRNMREAQREAEELREQLAEQAMQQQFNPPPVHATPAAQPAQQEDEMGWLREEMRAAVQETITPLQQRIEQSEQQARNQQIIATFQSQHPEFDRGRDQEILVAAMKRYGVTNLDAGYRIAFPERVVGAQQPEPTAPVSDVPGVSAHTPTDSPEALMKRFNDPNISEQERQAIAVQITNMGAFGGSAAEKALGF